MLDIRFTVDPKAEVFIKNLFLGKNFILGNKKNRVVYQITQIQTASPICFQEEMVYRCLSPLFILNNSLDGSEQYLSPKDGCFPKILKENLLRKFLNYLPQIQGLKDLDNYCPEIRFELMNEPQKRGIIMQTQ